MYRTSPETVIRVAGGVVAGPLEIGPQRAEFEIEVLPDVGFSGQMEIEISSVAYTPASDGLSDPRQLGVVLFAVEFQPENPAS